MPPILNSLTYQPGENAETVFARSKPTYINAAILASGAESIVNVPAGATICIFSGNDDFYARADAAAAVPGGNIADGSGSELNPAQWDVHDIGAIHLAGDGGTIVTLSFYR